MRIFLTGAQGQLGWELQRTLSPHDVTPADLPEFDLLSAQAEQQIVESHPQTVIHAAAYTDVEGAEREPERAGAINVEGTARAARAAAKVGARLIVISTDYVFDGRKGRPYLETDEPHPLGVYARTKRDAELQALALCPNTLIVRTAWLYGLHGKNFVKTILRLAREKPELRVVHDQRGSPTYAGDLAEALAKIVRMELSGIVHAVGEGTCTWYEFASAIVSLAGLSTPVKPITTAEADLRAPRPPYTVLANHRLARLGVVLPHWRDALTRFLKQVEVEA
jgi:dTDP-4-dehydrorhamnose reductase